MRNGHAGCVCMSVRAWREHVLSVTTLASAGQKPELQHCLIKQLSAGAQGFQKEALGKLLQDYGYFDIFLCSLSKGTKLCHVKDC